MNGEQNYQTRCNQSYVRSVSIDCLISMHRATWMSHLRQGTDAPIVGTPKTHKPTPTTSVKQQHTNETSTTHANICLGNELKYIVCVSGQQYLSCELDEMGWRARFLPRQGPTTPKQCKHVTLSPPFEAHQPLNAAQHSLETALIVTFGITHRTSFKYCFRVSPTVSVANLVPQHPTISQQAQLRERIQCKCAKTSCYTISVFDH